MDHQPSDHDQHEPSRLPDLSSWSLALGLAALVLGAALIFWTQDHGNDFAPPLVVAAAAATAVAIIGWAMEDSGMRRRAGASNLIRPVSTRFTQVVTFAIAEGQLAAAREGVLQRLEASDSGLRGLNGFQDLRITLSPTESGPSQALVETTWSDRERLASYEETRKTVLDLLAGHPDEVVPGSVQVFDMEVVRDTKEVSFHFGTGAAFTMISALLLGGFMFGAGLSLFQDDGGGGTGGEATAAPVEQPFRVTATDNKFDKRVITAGPNAEITITLVNRGAAKHNIHFTDKAGGATLADGAQGAIIDGGTETTVTFTTPAAGEYYFLCDLHPADMNGTFTVVEGGPTGTGEAAAAPAS